jgi:recombination protein RecA
MAKKTARNTSNVENLDDIMNKSNEKYGQGTVFTGAMMKKDPPRLPSGIFAIDFATGGGFPIYNTTCLWGKESGGKSAIATKAVATASMICWKCFNVIPACTCSKNPLKMRSFWADVEGTMDRDWMNFLGAYPDTYLAALADYGEQYIDVAESALQADDCGLVVIDSLAALVPEKEFEAPSEDQFMGTQARMIGRAVRKLKQRLIREMKREHPCTVIFTNQLRMKIGVMYGDPETMSGGHAMKHEFHYC